MTVKKKKSITKKKSSRQNHLKKTIRDSINKENVSSFFFTLILLILGFIAITTYINTVGFLWEPNVDVKLIQKISSFVHEDDLFIMNRNNFDWNTRRTNKGPGIIMSINFEFHYIHPGKLIKNKLYNIPLENFKSLDGSKFSTEFYSINNFLLYSEEGFDVFPKIPTVKPAEGEEIKKLLKKSSSP